MRKVVGISLKIKRNWLDAVLDRLAETTDEASLRSFLDEKLKEELPGKEGRAKTIGILLRIWSGIPPERAALRDRAVAMLPRISGQERIWLHWGMAALAYPFFKDTAEVVGRFLALQDDFTTAQVKNRIITTWGDRTTSREAAQYLLNSLVDWEVLRATKQKGHFLLARKQTASTPDLQLWLLEALLAASGSDEIEAQQLLRLPESFPFTISVGVADLRRHEGFDIHRQGLDMDMVALHHVKPQPKPKTPKKPAKRPKKEPASLFVESPPAPTEQSVVPTTGPVAGAIPGVVSRPRLSVTPAMAPAAANAVPDHGSGRPEPVQVRQDRLASVAPLDLPPETPFGPAIAQCVRLYHEGKDFACIALTHETIDAILRLICRVRLGPRQAKCADIRSQFGALAALGHLPTTLKTQIEKLWYVRAGYLELNPTEDLDRSALDGVAADYITSLIDLVHRFLGSESEDGKVTPAHAEYWSQGRKKLPFKAGVSG